MGGLRRTGDAHAKESTVVVVAVDATKEITNYALEWAICNIVQPNDTLVLLAVIKPMFSGNPNNRSGFNQLVTSLLKKWNLRNDSIKEKKSLNGVYDENMQGLTEVCLEMMNDLCCKNNVKQVRMQVRILQHAQINSVADKAEEYQASWVILDRPLKKESEYCSRQITCNVIVVDHSIPKILQLINAAAAAEEEPHYVDALKVQNGSNESSQKSNSLMSLSSNASSSLGFSSDQDGAAAKSARELPPFKPTLQHYIGLVTENEQQYKRRPRDSIYALNDHRMSTEASNRQARTNTIIGGINESGAEGRKSVDSATTKRISSFKDRSTVEAGTKISVHASKDPPIIEKRWSTDAATIDHKSSMQPRQSFKGTGINVASRSIPRQSKLEREPSIRQSLSLPTKQPRKPPPLCSVCKHKAPIFGKPPRKFTYKEMERATDGFSADNFLSEGGFGPVYKGVLEDGQVVAVKKHKKASAQGASEFCSEVEVLSCAQHKNLVMLVGYCVEGNEWLLVYEFACNGSLDEHLHSKDERKMMTWHQRQKVAIGAARGLRYLHEDCRVGCIVHRDLRPKNILLTHDFEPMVGDFGLARWQTDGQTAEETRIVGTIGYLAPEYTQTGQITEKADVYAFGLLLIELISGLKIIDLMRCEKLHHLQWGMRMHELVDPRLNGNYEEREIKHMMRVSGHCISPDPEMRPRMSQVLRMLEEDMPSDSAYHQQFQTPNPIPRSNASSRRSKTPTPVSRSNVSPYRSQTPTPISRSISTPSYQRSVTPAPISRYNDSETHLCSQTQNLFSDNTDNLNPQILTHASRTIPTAHSPSYSKSFNTPFGQSKFVPRRYRGQNDEHGDNNMMKTAPSLRTDTTETAEMEKINNKKPLNHDDHFTTRKYKAYLQDSFFEFIQKTKGVSSSEIS